MGETVKNGLAMAGILVLATVLALGVRYIPFLGPLENFTMDYRVATLLPDEPQSSDIVVVSISEQTLEMFPYRSPVDRAFLAELVETLQAAGARAIFLDVLFDQPTEDDKDARLKSVLDSVGIPLVISYGRQSEGLTEEQTEFMQAFVAPGHRAFANLVKDPFDGVARWIFPGATEEDGSWVPGVPYALRERTGGPKVVVDPAQPMVEIAYRAGPDPETPPFKQFPAHTVKLLPKAWFKDKIVMVGFDLSDRDRHVTPFRAAKSSATTPGVLIHAHALAQLMDGRQAPRHDLVAALPATAIAALIGVALGMLEIAIGLRVAAMLVLIAGIWVTGFVLYSQRIAMIPLISPSAALGLSLWLTDAYKRRQERSQRRFIQGAFSKYISPDLLDELVKNPASLQLDPKRKHLTFLFTDVAGFTTVSESMDAASLADVMNRYLDGMVKTIFKHGGTVDKFIGDAVFAMFGAPKEQPDHARRAVACALDLDAYASKFEADEVAAGRKFGMTRIGVHTGDAAVGNFGAQERFEYTALGDSVNTASRLEGLNKYFGTRVCMSGIAAGEAAGQPSRPMGQVVLKGKTVPLPVLQPLTEEELASPFMLRYLAAYRLLEQGDPAARQAFADLAAENPDDGPTQLHLEQLEEGGTVSTLVVMKDK